MKRIMQRMIGVDIESWRKTGELVEQGKIASRAAFVREAHTRHLEEYFIYESLSLEDKVAMLVKNLQELLERLGKLNCS